MSGAPKGFERCSYAQAPASVPRGVGGAGCLEDAMQTTLRPKMDAGAACSGSKGAVSLIKSTWTTVINVTQTIDK